MSYVHDRHYSLKDAQGLLKKVKPMVRELVALKQQLDARGFDVYRHQYFGGTGPNGEKYFPTELERLVRILQSLDELGILVKGLEQGLIDFPHIRTNGEEVYLCFKVDEDEIRFWHSIDGGFAGRRPLAEL
jgi:hypothetical protein